MTLSSQQTKVKYTSDGTQKRFAVPFPLFAPEHVRCVFSPAGEREEEEITEFQVTGFDTQAGVYVEFFTAPPAGGLAIYRDTTQVQESDYPEGGKFPARVVELDFDKVVAMIQELQEGLDRAIKVPITSDKTPEELMDEIFGMLDLMEQYLNEALLAAEKAVAAKEAAASSAGQAKDFESLARKWAVNPEDVPVLQGLYSAFHWAMKAKQIAGGVTLSDLLNGTRKAEDGVGASEWALAQVNARAEEAAEKAQEALEGAGQSIAEHAALTDAHGASVAATANRIILRDGNGRSQIATPSAATDIANKAYVDGLIAGSGGAPKPQTAEGVGQWVRLSWSIPSTSAPSARGTLPAGGTWAYFLLAYSQYYFNPGDGFIYLPVFIGHWASVQAGGASVGGGPGTTNWGFAWRIA